jgi:hypothetical protein
MNKIHLVINAEMIIINLFRWYKYNFIDIENLYRLFYIIRDKFSNEYSDIYKSVFYDLDFCSIKRTVKYNENIFEFIGDKVVCLKCRIPNNIIKKYKFHPKHSYIDYILKNIIKSFVKNQK